MICPECKSATVSKIEGDTLLIECPECGWLIVSSCIDPIYEDTTEYEILIGANNQTTKDLLKVVTSIAGSNFISAKKIIESPGTILIKGQAPQIKEAAINLLKAKMNFDIVPNFPYL